MDHDHHHAEPAIPAGTETATDPVCGMDVAVKPDTRHAEFQDETFHFCSEKCQTKFKADPWHYASGRATGKKKAAPADVQYTCPMHPEIVRDAPGACPICGMALEPMLPSDEPSHELTDFTRRMWISAAAAVPLIVLTMGGLVGLPVRDWIGHQTASYLEFVLATPVVLWAAWPFFKRGWDSMVNRSPNMWTLISLGVGAAYLYSIVATFLPGLFPEQYRMGTGVGTYFEASVVIVALVFVGQVLELRARERTGDAIRALLDLAPKTARRILPDGTEYDAPLENIMEGDRLRVRPGDAVPVDGTVIEGRSVTGRKHADRRVDAGRKGSGRRGDRRHDQQERQPRDRGGQGRRRHRAGADRGHGVERTAVSCADPGTGGPGGGGIRSDRGRRGDLRLRRVDDLRAGTGAGLRHRVRRVGADHRLPLRARARHADLDHHGGRARRAGGRAGQGRRGAGTDGGVDTLIVDKTGTLTMGKPKLTDTVALGDVAEADLLSLAAALERGSEHPLAEAIVEGAEAAGAARQEAADFEAVTGKGVRGQIGGRAVALGNTAMMQEMGLDTGAAEAKADALRAEGKTAMFIAVDGALAGIVAVADPIKESTAQAIKELHAQGLRVIMATGDNERTAQAVAGKLGIDEVRAGILPEAKKDLIDQLRRDGHKIAMAGDGVNDAPALAAADVGIAMGTGADVAMESAGITLLGGDLMGIVRARKLARATLRNIKQNLFFAFAYNSLGVPIAAGLLYPVTGLLLSPMIAAAAMSLSSVSVISNALRLRRVDL